MIVSTQLGKEDVEVQPSQAGSRIGGKMTKLGILLYREDQDQAQEQRFPWKNYSLGQ